MMRLTITVGLLTFLASAASEDNVIEVFPTCSQAAQDRCFELDDVLNVAENVSNTTVFLRSGNHTVSSPRNYMLSNIFDVSLIGEENGTVFVTCSSGYGLAFFNATNLYIADIVFTNCGLTGSRLTDFVLHLNDFIELDFDIPQEIQVGIFIAQCMDLTMENVVVANTSGIGMIGINILGSSTISHSKFINNIGPNCSQIEAISLRLYKGNRSVSGRIGGGLYLLYQDVKGASFSHEDLNSSLSIARSEFAGNLECGYSAYTILNYQYLSPTKSIQYVVGGGGGLSIMAAQYDYAVSVDVEESCFFENLAVYGSGVQVGLFHYSLFNNITFTKCSFSDNGGSYAKGGAGVAMFLNFRTSIDLRKRQHQRQCEMCKVVSFIDSNFTNNRGSSQGGGLLVYSLASHTHSNYNLEEYDNIMTLTGCHFVANEAKYGSAFYAAQKVVHGLDGLFGVMMENVTIWNNSIGMANGRPNLKALNGNFASAVDLRSVNLIVKTGCWFTVEKSDSSALYIYSSVILMQRGSEITLKNNQGTQGGGILMEGYTPAIILAGRCTLSFIENKAGAKGGAVFFDNTFDELDDLYPLNAGDCFLFGSDIYKEMSDADDILSPGNKIMFIDNVAPQGSILYGSSLGSCPWAEPATPENMLVNLNSTETFIFSDLEIKTDKVSSDPASLTINEGSKRIETFPGRVEDVVLEVQDIFNRDIEAVLVADYFDGDTKEDLNFGDFIYKRANETSIRLAIPKVGIGNVSVTLYTESNLVSDSLNVEVKPCPFGFSETSSDHCECEDSSISGVYCNEEDVTLTVEGDTWFGCLPGECSHIGQFIVQRCKFGYCHSQNVTFNYSDIDNQCKNGSYRAGVLCGKCEDGYNVTSGSACGRCNVSNLYTLALIVLDSFILFLIFWIVGVTIEKEWTSIVFLFATLVFPYEFLSEKTTIPLRYALYLVNFVNRNRFTEVCYFFNLTALHRSAFTMLYIIYLLGIMIMFALICQYSSFMSKHFSPAKTVMTMAYVLYVKSFDACFEVIAPWPLWSLDNSVFDVRWAVDPNVKYCRDIFHAFLAIVSLLGFLVYLIPGFIFLLFPTKMYIYFKSFYPFLDIIWAPFKTKYRPWASVRLLFGVIIVTIAKYSWKFIVTLPITICFIGAFLYIQTTLQPFKSRLANVLDNFLLLVVLVMHIIALLLYIYEDFQTLYDDSTALNILVIVAVSILAVAYTVLFLMFVWYWKGSIASLYGKIKNYSKILYKRRNRKMSLFEVVDAPSVAPSQSSLVLRETVRIDYARYRESILED